MPSDTKGFNSRRLATAGLKSGDTAFLTFNNCRVLAENILGAPGKAFYYLFKGLQRERLICAVALNALSLQVIARTIDLLKSRKRFGAPLSDKQSIRHQIADLSTRVEASRQFTYAVCDSFEKGLPVDKEILMLKTFTYETCQQVIRECAHLHGAEAFLADSWLAHVLHDAQAFTLAAGVSEIMRDLLAEMVGL
jgi:acyl-CoA dehydrogenase